MKEELALLYQYNLDLFERSGVAFQQWEHEPILDFDTDDKIAAELGWRAAPTKSLFLTLKGGGHALLFTHRDCRLDGKAVKNALGKRPSIAAHQEMAEVTGCVPGAVCPFGLPEGIPMVVDGRLLEYPELMYTPGLPEWTVAFASKDLPALLESLPNRVVWLDDIHC